MTMFHAVVWVDHEHAQVIQFNAEAVQAQKLKAHAHQTKQHGSGVRTEHEFFGQVCDALSGISEILVVGPRTGCTDFKHYADKHRPETAKRVVGYETQEHQTDNQLVALARKYFEKYDRMAGTPVPT